MKIRYEALDVETGAPVSIQVESPSWAALQNCRRAIFPAFKWQPGAEAPQNVPVSLPERYPEFFIAKTMEDFRSIPKATCVQFLEEPEVKEVSASLDKADSTPAKLIEMLEPRPYGAWWLAGRQVKAGSKSEFKNGQGVPCFTLAQTIPSIKRIMQQLKAKQTAETCPASPGRTPPYTIPGLDALFASGKIIISGE